MLAAPSPVSGRHPISAPKSTRKPLQPKNLPSNTTTLTPSTANPSLIPAEWVVIHNSDKENAPPVYSAPVKKDKSSRLESFDTSLADELSAIREKLHRVRIDGDKTDKLLRERAQMLDLQMEQILNRGELQKQLEIELDRLYRLKEIKLACKRASPLRSLRDKESEKKMKQDELKANVKSQDHMDERRDENPSQCRNPEVNPQNEFN